LFVFNKTLYNQVDENIGDFEKSAIFAHLPKVLCMADLPRNIIFLIADSLRYDSVYDQGIGMPYVQKTATSFTEARSAGCWTLPATASMFTGLVPHEHGASSQTRNIHKDIPTLATQMKAAGYNTYQVTANVATTHIFGLDRGFDEVRRIWKYVPPKFNTLQKLIVLFGKPRLRAKLFSRDLLMQRMSEDMESAKTWLQQTYQDIFDQARKIIEENEAKGQKSFIFLNMMETHFPYHIAPTFQTSTPGMINKIKEVRSMFHMLNQTFLKQENDPIKDSMKPVLKNRQYLAWKDMAASVDSFCKEMHEGTGNLVVFGSDHGETFGEDNWMYHFSNVTDGGNKVPMFWMSPNETQSKVIDDSVSVRHIYNSFMKAIGQETNGPSMLHDPERSLPVVSSYWYNNKGKTLDKYRYNQMCLVLDKERYRLRNGEWAVAPFAQNGQEPTFTSLGVGTNPLHELSLPSETKKECLKKVEDFTAFSDTISFK